MGNPIDAIRGFNAIGTICSGSPGMSLAQKRQYLSKGFWSERLALMSLVMKGCRPLARNFRCKAGEIDIIASKGDLIAIFEVKARRGLHWQPTP